MTMHRSALGAGFAWATVLAAAMGPSVTGAGSASSRGGSEWRLIGGNVYEQHYSELHQVDDKNAKNLKLAWYADIPTPDAPVGVPIIADGAVYQSGNLGRAWAHDVRTGKLLWSFDAGMRFPTSNWVPSWGSRVNRGLAIWEDVVLTVAGDCRLFGLDRRTGAKIWEAQPCDPNLHQAITGAPRVGDGKVFIGNTNADYGMGAFGRGHVDAFDAKTGKHLWRFYTMPGDPARGFENAAMEMASKTWGPEYWKNAGAGSPWEGITYDPRTDLVYIGTDGPKPMSPRLRPAPAGDELFTNAIVAVKADTGEYVWHYSTTPGDGWNYAATMPVVLANLSINGKEREVVMSAPKNGFFYVLDAHSGKLVNEPKPIVAVNWASHIDMATGRPIVNEDAKYWLKGKDGASIVSPNPMGAHSWMPMSFNPQTGLVYIPVSDFPSLMGEEKFDIYYAMRNGLTYKGSLLAWDPVRQTERWRRDIGRPYQGGTLTTAGNLVFQGTTSGYFRSYRADTGEQLWSFYVGSGISGGASTVEVDGEQLILVPAGPSPSPGSYATLFADPAPGPARLFAFSLHGKAKLPPIPQEDLTLVEPPEPPPEPALAEQGRAIYYANGCELCHGIEAIAGRGSVPDLRRLNAPRYELFSQIVRGGLLKANGMPIFADSISEEQLPALKAYILEQAWRGYREQQATGKKP